MKDTTTITHKFDIDHLGSIEIDFEARLVSIAPDRHPDDPATSDNDVIEVTKINRVFFEVGDSICALDLEPYLKFKGKLIDVIEDYLNEYPDIYYEAIGGGDE